LTCCYPVTVVLCYVLSQYLLYQYHTMIPHLILAHHCAYIYIRSDAHSLLPHQPEHVVELPPPNPHPHPRAVAIAIPFLSLQTKDMIMIIIRSMTFASMHQSTDACAFLVACRRHRLHHDDHRQHSHHRRQCRSRLSWNSTQPPNA